MDGGKYLARIDGLTKQNRLLGLVVIVMLIWNVMNWAQASRMQAKTQVVVIPMGQEGMQIGNGRASERYLRRMARYITNMVGTYSAATARDQLMELLDLFPPENVANVQTAFERIATDIERFPSISSHVQLTGETPLRYSDGLLQVQVRKSRLVNGAVSDTRTVVYCLPYRVDETRFWLINIEEKDLEGEGFHEAVCLSDADTTDQ